MNTLEYSCNILIKNKCSETDDARTMPRDEKISNSGCEVPSSTSKRVRTIWYIAKDVEGYVKTKCAMNTMQKVVIVALRCPTFSVKR